MQCLVLQDLSEEFHGFSPSIISPHGTAGFASLGIAIPDGALLLDPGKGDRRSGWFLVFKRISVQGTAPRVRS